MSVCKSCFDEYTKQADLLLRVVNSNVEEDARRLASDILYGLLSTMYEVDDEEGIDDEEEEVPPYIHTHEGDGFTITVTNLSDLFKNAPQVAAD